MSVDLHRGESLGIIGRNGSGKSTLLRLLAGVALPTEGTVEANVRVASLLDLGTGFHPHETGRQNAEGWLVLLGGMARREARAATREVERFAAIGAYFDRPLRTYSQGMMLRVAFATATLLEPDLLISDEILAVGDESFQRKCSRFFDRLLARGGGLVLCTHDLAQVSNLCPHALWLERGRPAAIGEVREVVGAYRDSFAAPSAAAAGDAGRRHAPGQSAGLPFEVVDLRLLDERGTDTDRLESGATAIVVADVSARAAVPHVHLSFTRADGVPLYGVSSDMENAVPEALGGDRWRFRLTFPEIPLAAGRWVLKGHALDETATRVYDTVEIPFEVLGDDAGGSLVRLPARTVSGGAS